MTSPVTHDCDFWDGDHHVTSLSGYIGFLEKDARVLVSSVMCIVHFIQKHPIGGHPIEQFPPILGAGSVIWTLLQAVSEAGWDRFKISPQPDVPSLVEALRTVYDPSLLQESSPDIEIAVDEPVVAEAPYTIVTNKKRKDKGKVPSAANPLPSQNVLSTTPAVVSRAPLPHPQPAKTAATKPTPAKVATAPQAPKIAPKSFVQATHNGSQPIPRFAPTSAHPEYENLLRLGDMFPDVSMEKVLAMYQSGFGIGVAPNRRGATHPGASRAPKMTTHGPTRCQVLILLDVPTSEVVVANAAAAVESCNRGLVDAHSESRVCTQGMGWYIHVY